MNGPENADFTALREGRADCPSDLTLDRLVSGELDAAGRSAAEAHVAGCAECRGRVEARRAGFDAVQGVDPRALLSGIRRRLDEAPPRRGLAGWFARWSRDWRRSWAPLGAVAAAAALLLLVWPRPVAEGPGGGAPGLGEPGGREHGGPAVRRKGGPILHVWRAPAGAAATDGDGAPTDGTGATGGSEALSGDRFQAGDRLRFVVDLPTEGQVAVLGVDASGALYQAWPLPGNDAETLRPAGPRQTLPGAVALDETPGRETLHVVLCPPDTPPLGCTSRGPDEAPACPVGCVTSPFVLEKGR